MKIVTILFSCLFSYPVLASGPGYHLDVELSIDGKAVASPKIVVLKNKKGTIVVDSSESKTFIDVIATEGEVGKSKGILMKFELGRLNDKGQRELLSKPTILAQSGSKATIQVKGETELVLAVTATRKTI